AVGAGEFADGDGRPRSRREAGAAEVEARMRRWISLTARFYPKNWRDEYGPEFNALLEDVRPGWRVLANVLGGAVKMQMTNGRGWLKLSAVMAVAGAIVAVMASFAVDRRYVSSAVMTVMPQADPLRPASDESAKQRAADHLV